MHLVLATALAWSVAFLVLNAAAGLLPLFDASPRLVHSSPWPLVRWDTLHFAAIADGGYRYEHQWAFLPAAPYLLHVFGLTWWPLALLFSTCASAVTLYQLSLHHFPNSPSLARLATLASLLPTSYPAVYFAPYAEPFFTFLSYRGMLHAARKEWILATLCSTAATAFRSNGILLSGYILWGLVVYPFLARKKVSLLGTLYAASLTVVVWSPFIYHNYLGYTHFCLDAEGQPPSWCTSRIPSIYSYVQAEYWNVGFMRYWTASQIPNFLIATPSLLLLLAFAFYHVTRTIFPLFSSRIFHYTVWVQPDSPFLTLTITPHVIHTIVLLVALIFFSHTQIILRLSAALPTIYWASAWLLTTPEGILFETCGSLWLWWSFLWGFATIGFWVAFLPPA